MSTTEATTGPKQALFWLVLVGLAALLVELFLRVAFAFVVGPSVLSYGFGFDRFEATVIDREKFSVEQHSNRRGAYGKYFPYQERTDYDRETGEMFPVSINGQGFRGKDFSPTPADGVVRVLSLGASSTFGYTNRDHETYPAQLEAWLGAHCPETRFEVLNLGIPHLESHQVASLLEEEGLAFSPRVVTLYIGSNDAAQTQARIRRFKANQEAGKAAEPAAAPAGPSLWQRASNRLLAAALVGQLLRDQQEDTVLDLDRHAAPVRESFRQNLDRILGIARNAGVELIVATQQARSMMIPRSELRGVTYADEVARVRAKLALRGALRSRELKLLTHDLLMSDLIAWAAKHEVPLVDVRAALDPHRDVLVSHVHLSPEGNRAIAERLGTAILQSQCPSTPRRVEIEEPS